MSLSHPLAASQNNKQAEGRPRRPSAASRALQDRLARRTFFVITLLPVFLILTVTVALLARSWPIPLAAADVHLR